MNQNTNSPQYIGIGGGEVHHKQELPIYGLPKYLQQYINELTRMYQCPREFVTVAVLSAISTIVGNRVTISDGVYKNSLSLWWVNIARSGSNKTQPVKNVISAIADMDKEIYEQYLNDMYHWEVSKGEDGPKPRYRTLLVGDMTEESRHTILNDNPNGVLGYYPEIKGFFDDLDRYNKSGSVARVLRLWDNDTIKVTRKTEDKPIVIERPFMNILGDLQPDLLKDTFGNKLFMSNGLPQRFLFCYPEHVDFPERSNYTLPAMVESYLPERLRALYNNINPSDGTPLLWTDTIKLSTEADTLYNNYYNTMQRYKDDASNDYMASLYSKEQIQVLRLAGIIQVANALEPGEGFDLSVVSEDTMRYAIECMDYFENSAMRVYEAIMNKHKTLPPLCDKQVLGLFTKRFKINNLNQFAHSIAVDRSYIARIINEYVKK